MVKTDKPVRTWRGSCEDCAHWQFHDDGTGHCMMQSSECITSIVRNNKPTWFLSRAEVKEED